MANLSGLYQSRWVETDRLRGESMTGVGGVPMPRRMVDELLRPEDPWRTPRMDESTSSTARVLFGPSESRHSTGLDQGMRGGGLNRRYGEGTSATDVLGGSVKRHLSGYSVFDPDGRVPDGGTPPLPAPAPRPAPDPVDVWNVVGGASGRDMQAMAGPAYRTPEPHGYPAAERNLARENFGNYTEDAGELRTITLADGTPLLLPVSMMAMLPNLRGMDINKAYKELGKSGFVLEKMSGPANNSKWQNQAGYVVKVHPYGDIKFNLHYRTANNAHYHLLSPSGQTLNVRGIPSKVEGETHIGMRNPADLPQLRRRPHGSPSMPVFQPSTYTSGYKPIPGQHGSVREINMVFPANPTRGGGRHYSSAGAGALLGGGSDISEFIQPKTPLKTRTRK